MPVNDTNRLWLTGEKPKASGFEKFYAICSKFEFTLIFLLEWIKSGFNKKVLKALLSEMGVKNNVND